MERLRSDPEARKRIKARMNRHHKGKGQGRVRDAGRRDAGRRAEALRELKEARTLKQKLEEYPELKERLMKRLGKKKEERRERRLK